MSAAAAAKARAKVKGTEHPVANPPANQRGVYNPKQPWASSQGFWDMSPLEQFAYAQYYQAKVHNGQEPTGFMRADMWKMAKDRGAINANGSLATPAAPAAPGHWDNHTVQPFQNPQEMIQSADENQQWQSGLANLDAAFSQKAADTKLQAGDINPATHQLNKEGLIYHQGLIEHTNADENLVARGLFQSSIRTGDLSDIDATTALRRQSMIDALSLQKAADDRARGILNAHHAAFQTGMNAQMVQNAQNMPTQPATWVPDPLTPDQTKYIQAATAPPPPKQPWEADPYFHQLHPLEQFSYAQYWQKNHPNGTTVSPNGFMRSDMWQTARKAGWQG